MPWLYGIGIKAEPLRVGDEPKVGGKGAQVCDVSFTGGAIYTATQMEVNGATALMGTTARWSNVLASFFGRLIPAQCALPEYVLLGPAPIARNR
jgi:hypothetical protein